MANTQNRPEEGKRPEWSENWSNVKKELRSRNTLLTDQDLDYNPGKEDDLYGRLEKRLGKTREEVRQLVDQAHRSTRGTYSREPEGDTDREGRTKRGLADDLPREEERTKAGSGSPE